MAIKVSGTTVIDNDRNFSVGILTASTLDVPPAILSLSPADGSSSVDLDSNIVVTYNTDLVKGPL